MKKLVLTACILSTVVASHAATSTINAAVTVYSPIKLVTTNPNFPAMIAPTAGGKEIDRQTTGTYTVSGSNGKGVRLTIAGNPSSTEQSSEEVYITAGFGTLGMGRTTSQEMTLATANNGVTQNYNAHVFIKPGAQAKTYTQTFTMTAVYGA